MRSLSFSILLFFILSVVRINAQVQEQRYMKSLPLASIASNATITVKDPVDVNRYTEKNYKVLVKLVYGREDRTDVKAKTFSYSINYNLAYLNQQGQVNATTQTGDVLQLAYAGDAGSNTEAYQAFSVPSGAENWCGATLTVTAIPTSVTPPSDLRLEVHLICTYRLRPDLLSFQGALSYNGTSKELVWQYQRGASAYQLEWVYIDNESVFSPAPATAADYFMLKEPVRVMVKEQYFHFEPKYATGKVYARVRAVWQYGGDSNNQPHYCDWQYLSSPTQINIVNTLPGVNEIQAFEVNKTWQYTAQYSENGKATQAIAYYDGSLRSRQSIALMNSENVSVVSETLYDYEGRPVISVMPYPIAGTSMNYRFRDNVFQAEGITPDKSIYDKPYAGSSSVAMDSVSGAANYYSSSNTINSLRNTINTASIPRAKGYVYSQVQYMQDGTGRLMRKNTPGEAFVINSSGGNYNSYYYDQAKPMELQRLFGKNVGNAQHYQKNYVMDNNGQVTVTYVDQSGKVVATAVVGDAPTKNGTTILTAIQDNAAAAITISLSAQNTFDAATGTLTSVNKQMNMMAGTSYTLHYDLKGVVDKATETFTSCNAFAYDLEIVITAPDGTALPKYSFQNLSASSLSCSATNFAITPALDATVIFNQVGTYTITKKLTLNKTSMDVLTATIAASPLAPSLSAITATYRAAVDYSSCDLTCRDRALTANPALDPNSPSYVYNINNETYIKDWIRLNNCDNVNTIIDGNPIADNSCAALLQLMTEELPSLGITNIILHPEYCHYTACMRETASRAYDMKMASVANWTDGVALGYYNPLDMSAQTSTYGSVSANKDPLLTSPDYSAILQPKLNEMKTSTAGKSCLTNYVMSGKTLWQYANDPASYPLGGATAFNNLSAEEQDAQKWRTFSSAYQGLKQQLIYELKTTTGNAWSCAYRNSEYAIVQDPLLIGDRAVLQAKIDAEMTSGCGTLCDLNATTWLTNLIEGGCSTPALTETEKTTILTYLKNYCIANCGASNPWGLLLSRHITDVRGSSNNSKPGYSDLRAALAILDAKVSCDLLNTSYVDPYVYSGPSIGTEVMTPIVYDIVSATNALLAEARSPQNIITTCPVSGNALFYNKAYTKKNSSNVGHGQYNFYTYNKGTCSVKPEGLGSKYYSVIDDRAVKFPFVHSANEIYRPYMFMIIASVATTSDELCKDTCNSFRCESELNSPYIYVSYNSVTNQYTYLTKDKIQSVSNPRLKVLPQVFTYTFTNPYGATGLISKSVELDAILLDATNQPYNNVIYLINLTPNDNYNLISYPRSGTCGGGYSPDYYTLFETQIAAPAVTGLATCPTSVQPATGPKTLCGTNVTVNLATLRQQCRTEQLAAADSLAKQKYQEALQTFTTTFLTSHVATCFNSNLVENYTLQYSNKEYQYTLYYYDHAGNLSATVPPEGVYPLTASSFTNGILKTTATDPVHKLLSYYRYNSAGQTVSQQSPDAGVSKFFYDSKGQLRLSQNAKQLAASSGTINQYSYTKFDGQGRQIESGQVNDLIQSVSYFTDAITRKDALVLLDNASLPNNNTYKDVVKTYYDAGTSDQKNVRHHVATTITYNNGITPDSRTSYSYDTHGNIIKLTQEPVINQVKTIEYSYDVISNLVKRLDYQNGYADQYSIKYSYDADNRLRNTYSSIDNGLSWKEDAEYFYYLHGPSSRLEYGQNKVQGMDYAYTIQGWLKMGNTPHVRQQISGLNYKNTVDIGNDGIGTGVNQYVGQDEFAYALGYHNKDYSSIGTTDLGLAGDAATKLAANISGPGLYNGNVTWQITQLNRLAEKLSNSNDKFGVRASAYKYDQLNRLLIAQNYIPNTSTGILTINTSQYQSNYSYDRNGNLKTANAAGTGSWMDQFTYNYARDGAGRLTTNNLLTSVTDGASANDAAYTTDINSGQAANNYTYDEVGNLVGNVIDGTTIEWTVSGKVRKVTTPSYLIDYDYDAAGNRISKKLTYNVSGVSILTQYIRDAAGTVLATYTNHSAAPNIPVEFNLYGSTRVGRLVGISLTKAANALDRPASFVYLYKPGNYQYELCNHLGNVQAVITGLKLGEDTNADQKSDMYRCSIISLVDYYPFGMGIESRTFFYVDQYRYGFNGKEKDIDGMGTGSSTYDYGFRIYNPALGRFLSVDPLTKSYPWYTPYQFASNSPILAIDVDGLESYPQALFGFKLEVLPKFHVGLYYAYKTNNSNIAVSLTTYQSDKNGISLNVGYTPNISYDFNFNGQDVYAKASMFGYSPSIKINTPLNINYQYNNSGVIDNCGVVAGYNFKTSVLTLGVTNSNVSNSSYNWTAASSVYKPLYVKFVLDDTHPRTVANEFMAKVTNEKLYLSSPNPGFSPYLYKGTTILQLPQPYTLQPGTPGADFFNYLNNGSGKNQPPQTAFGRYLQMGLQTGVSEAKSYMEDQVEDAAEAAEEKVIPQDCADHFVQPDQIQEQELFMLQQQ